MQQQQCQLNEILSAVSGVISSLDTKKIALPEGVGIGDEADQNIVGAQSRLGSESSQEFTLRPLGADFSEKQDMKNTAPSNIRPEGTSEPFSDLSRGVVFVEPTDVTFAETMDPTFSTLQALNTQQCCLLSVCEHIPAEFVSVTDSAANLQVHNISQCVTPATTNGSVAATCKSLIGFKGDSAQGCKQHKEIASDSDSVSRELAEISLSS